MRIVELDEVVGNGDVIRLHHITDTHVGKPDFAEPELKERIELIRIDEKARWTMGGDGGDLIRFNDRRYSTTELDPRYRQATDIRAASKEHLVELFEPITDKCWGWCDGNHERKMDNVYGGYFGVETCCALGIEDKFVGYNGFIHVRFTVGSRKAQLGQLIDLAHGWQAGRIPNLTGPQREFSTTAADIVLRGHNHKPLSHEFPERGITHGSRGRARVMLRPRTFINGGSWTRGYRDDLAPINANKLSEVEGDLWHEAKQFPIEGLGGPVLVLGFDMGHGEDRSPNSARAAVINHTVLKGHIDAERLGL